MLKKKIKNESKHSNDEESSVKSSEKHSMVCIEPEPKQKGIPVVFNSIPYDSKLEGTWACFFTSLGLKFEKSIDTFRNIFESQTYLPDFDIYLDEGPITYEVKPFAPSGIEEERVRSASVQAERPFYLCYGDVAQPYSTNVNEFPNPKAYRIRKYYKGTVEEGYVWMERNGVITLSKRQSLDDLAWNTTKLNSAYKFADACNF